MYNYYNSQLLNESFIVVNDSINVGNAIAPGYLLATLVAYNATITPTSQDGDQETGSATPNNSSNTGLAMSVQSLVLPSLGFLFDSMGTQDHLICHHRVRFRVVLHCYHLWGTPFSFADHIIWQC